MSFSDASKMKGNCVCGADSRDPFHVSASSINIARLIIVLERANIASFKSHEFYSNFSQPLFDYEIINFVRIENEALRCE